MQQLARRTSAGRRPTPAGPPARPAGPPRGGGPRPSSRGRAGRASTSPASSSPEHGPRRRRCALPAVTLVPPRRLPARARPATARAGRRPRCPRRWRSAFEVVGRRTPTGERSAPARALNSEDLPLPVDPGERDDRVLARRAQSRSPARPDTVRARCSAATSARPSSASTASSRATSIPGRSARRWRPRSLGLTGQSSTSCTAARSAGPAASCTGRRPAGSVNRLRSPSRSPVTRRRRSARACSASVRTAWSPSTASRTFWLSADAPPATATSPATSPPVCAKTTIITIRPRPFTPNAR